MNPKGVPVLIWLVTVMGASALVSNFHAAEVGPIVGGLENHRPSSLRISGSILVSELGCAACHSTSTTWLAPKPAPDLTQAGARINPAHLQRFIANPSGTKPGTTMPDVLGHLPEAERQQAALALAHYLATLGNKPLRFEQPGANSIERGKTLYHSVGCVACHSPEKPLAGSVPLGPLKEKYSLSSLTRFLEDPLSVRPGGRMPDSHLEHFDALDIAGYLLRDQPEMKNVFVPDPKLATQGKALFSQHRCDACHEIGGRRSSPALSPLKGMRLDKGCLGNAAGPWPRYPLSTEQRAAIRSVLGTGTKPFEPAESIDLVLTRLNCIACHQRGDIGGISENRTAFFTGVDENLGEQGRLPPPLTGVGAKLKRDWLRDVVANGASVRPYLRTRMPKFGAANTEVLVDLLKQQDMLPAVAIDRVPESDKPNQIGRDLAGSSRFNCVACHTFRGRSAAPIRALDLTTMTERLEENWFHLYLANPQKFSPLTIMPGFWPDGKSPLPDVLSGHPGRQRNALWRYLSEGPEAAEPRGLVLEPLVVAVSDEAVMLRRNYPGIGKRGIGVGYPSGINLSFDAGQMRLASMWTGGFVEASGIWRGQGAGQVHVLGKNTVNFPAGAALAVLESATSRWPTNTANRLEEFQFKGYTLDAKRRPTFLYQFGELAVQDRFLDMKNAAGLAYLERTLEFTHGKPPPGLHLLLARDPQIEQRDDGEFQIGGRLGLRLPEGAILRGTGAGVDRELLLPVTSAARLKIEYHLTSKP